MALSAVPPGYESRFDVDLYRRIVLGLRSLASMLCVVSITLGAFARPLSVFLIRAASDAAEFSRDVARRMALLRNDPLHLLGLVIVFVGAVILRLAFLQEPIRKDEAYTFMYYGCRPLWVGLTYYTANNHLLNTLLMHISTGVFGASLWSARLPTFLAGVLVVPGTYAVTRLYHGKNAGLVAAALVSGSSPLIEFSFNARGYSLGTLFFLLMILIVGLAKEGVEGSWALLPILAALSLYSVPTMMYGVGGVFVYLLISRWELRKTVLAMICTGLLTIVLYSPVLATVGLSAITHNKWVIPVPRNMWLSQFGRELVSLWIYWNLDLPRIIVILLGLGIVAAAFAPKTLRLPPVAVFFCVVILAGLLLPIQRLVPYRRTWLFLLPLCFASAAVGFNFVVRKFRYADVISIVVALLLSLWMGGSVLAHKSLRHSGIEANGGRSSELVVLAMKERLLHGDQFICADGFDSPMDFEMYIHNIPYRPSPSGDLLIVTPAGDPPERTFSLAGIPAHDVLSIHKIGRYGDEDVYQGQRAPTLPFEPIGSTEMGEFKTSRR